MARLLTLTLCGLILAAPSARAAEIDPLLPPDTEAYVAVNVRQILDSDLFKKQLQPAVRDVLDSLPEVRGILKDLGFDPLTDLDRLQFASPSTGESDRGLVIVRGKFDPAKIQGKADALARDHEDALKRHKVPDGTGGTHLVYEALVPGGPSVFVAIFDNQTLLVSPGKDYVVDAIKQGTRGKKAELKNVDFQAVLEKLDLRQSVSLAVLGKIFKGDLLDAAPDLVKEAVEKIEAIGGGLTLEKDVKLELTLATTKADDARALRDSLNRGLQLGLAAIALLGSDEKEVAFALDVLKSLKVQGKGKVVTIRARIHPDAFEDALKKDE